MQKADHISATIAVSALSNSITSRNMNVNTQRVNATSVNSVVNAFTKEGLYVYMLNCSQGNPLEKVGSVTSAPTGMIFRNTKWTMNLAHLICLRTVQARLEDSVVGFVSWN